jgi:hypothetical protein
MRNAWAVISMALCPGIFFTSGSHNHAWIMIHWVHKYYSADSVKKNLICHDFLGIYPDSKLISTFRFFTSTRLVVMRQKIKFINLFP